MDKNKNSRLKTFEDTQNCLWTITDRRDEDTSFFSVVTDVKNNSTKLLMSLAGDSKVVELTGREAKTILHLLRRHYAEKSSFLYRGKK